MVIVFDYDHPPGSPLEGRHIIDTTPGQWPQASVAVLGPNPVDMIDYVKAMHTGAVSMAGTGWDVPTKHPLYPGQTRLDALIGEIIRLNDTAARGVLGV